MPQRLVRDVISNRPPVSVSPQTTVRKAAQTMTLTGVGAVLVMERGKIQGIFTERDALNRVLAVGLDPDTTPVDGVMTAHPRCMEADRPLSYAMEVMHDSGFRHMPVTADGEAVGVISMRDALGVELIHLEQNVNDLEHIAQSL